MTLHAGPTEFERLLADSILRAEGVEIQQNTGFVLLPQHEAFDRLFENVIRPAMTANGIITDGRAQRSTTSSLACTIASSGGRQEKASQAWKRSVQDVTVEPERASPATRRRWRNSNEPS